MKRGINQICHDINVDCFARTYHRRCKILNDTQFQGCCPFAKKYADITEGKRYPYDVEYEEIHRRTRHDDAE